MKSIFSYRLKRLREQKKINQTTLADYLKVSQITVSNWEAGRQEPPMKVLEKIARYFEVDLNYLFGSDNETQAELHFAREKEFEEYQIHLSEGGEDYLEYKRIEQLQTDDNDEYQLQLHLLYEGLKLDEKTLNAIYNIEPVRKEKK